MYHRHCLLLTISKSNLGDIQTLFNEINVSPNIGWEKKILNSFFLLYYEKHYVLLSGHIIVIYLVFFFLCYKSNNTYYLVNLSFDQMSVYSPNPQT